MKQEFQPNPCFIDRASFNMGMLNNQNYLNSNSSKEMDDMRPQQSIGSSTQRSQQSNHVSSQTAHKVFKYLDRNSSREEFQIQNDTMCSGTEPTIFDPQLGKETPGNHSSRVPTNETKLLCGDEIGRRGTELGEHL